MKQYQWYLMACVMLMGWACAKETGEPVQKAVPATISVAIPEDGLSKVTLSQEGDVVKLYWEDTDVITVKDAADESRSVAFAYLSGAGTSQARFRAADISPLSGASAYNIYLTSHLPGGYAHQTQAVNASTAHLGYAASVSGIPGFDGVTFSQAWATSNGGSFASSSVLKVQAQMPTAADADKVQKVYIKASSALFAEDDKVDVTILAPGVEGDGKTVTIYATLPVGDVIIPAGTEFVFQFQLSDDPTDMYTAYRKVASAASIKSGQVNSFTMACPDIASFAGADDDGSESKPYLLGDRHQMQAMHTLLGNEEKKYFKMVDDVDLAAITSWTPLCLNGGDNKNLYFDGNGHTIFNMNVDDSQNYPSFAGYLWGEVNHVTFDGAVISCGSTKEQSAGVVAGYMGGSSHQADCHGVTIRNSTLTSAGAYVGGLAARVGKSAEILDCHVVNTSVTLTEGTNAAGLVSYIASNAALTISDCSAERITVTGFGHYAGGLVSQIASNNPVSIRRCHTSGTVTRNSSGRHFGGLIGSVQSADVQIVNCYSTCSVTGYQFNGGLVGSFWSSASFTGGSGVIDHCFASGAISDTGNSGDGGLVGTVEVPGVKITNSIAWNTSIAPKRYGEGNYSSGAIVGRTHPNSRLEDNYRKPGLDLTAYWVPSASFDQPNSKKTGDVYYIWRIGTDLIESNGAYSTATAFSAPNGVWAYHGKHLSAGAVVEPDAARGWVSSDIPGETDDTDPENPSYTGNNIWNLGTTKTITPGVEWTTFHGTWQGEVRNINIVRTTLSATNHLGVFYDYSTDELKYLNEKCVFMNAVAGTNGSMACCQFVRVNDVVRHAATVGDEWINNCALTIDDDEVNIVKVESNFDAATLPNKTVSCGGPLLVWKGNKLVAPAAWESADTDNWLGDTHPRTAIGLLKDRKTVIQVTVDGRWTSSNTDRRAIGMSTNLLAQLMLELGCYKAMNLDGGGGTQMWIRDEGDIHNIVNHPHNTWPVYGTTPEHYHWINNGEVARRTTGSAIYIY